MTPSWRVHLDDDVVSWARALRVSDPEAARWLMPAFAVLELLGRRLQASSLQYGCTPVYPGQPGLDFAMDTGKILFIDCQLRPAVGMTYVWRCAVVGPAREVTAVIFRMQALPDRAARRSYAAVRLVGAVTQILPALEGARYAEEFFSELCELASSGVPRRQQLAYSARLLARVWLLRAALRPRNRTRAPEADWLPGLISKIRGLAPLAAWALLGSLAFGHTSWAFKLILTALGPPVTLGLLKVLRAPESIESVFRRREDLLRARSETQRTCKRAAEVMRQQFLDADLAEHRRLHGEDMIELLAPQSSKSSSRPTQQEIR